MKDYLVIESYTYFLVKPNKSSTKDAERELETFLGHFKTYERTYVKRFDKHTKKWFGQMVTKLSKVFYINDGTYIRLPIGCIREFKKYLEMKFFSYEEIVSKNANIESIDFTLTDTSKKPRPYQNKCINHIYNNGEGMYLIEFRTGMGKTFTSISTLSKFKYKFGVLVLPKYIDKWVSDITSQTDIKENEIYIFSGGDSINNIVKNPEILKKIKCFIFSMRTTSNYINEFETPETRAETKYLISPDELFNKLGIGVLLNDETHQEFHAMYRILLRTQAPIFIGMSATLDSNNPRIRNLYKVTFPPSTRINEIVETPDKKYIHVKSTTYKVSHPKNIKCESVQGYHQVTYEQFIMKRPKFLAGYRDMILYYVDKDFIKRRNENEKLLIFVGSVDLAKYLSFVIKREYPDLDVRSYVEDDEYDNVISADICVSTVLSSGTAVDIPGLINVIQTISLGSLPMNQQALGRLRQIKGREVVYRYLYCSGIRKHRDLNKQRIDAIGHLWNKFTLETYKKSLFSK